MKKKIVIIGLIVFDIVGLSYAFIKDWLFVLMILSIGTIYVTILSVIKTSKKVQRLLAVGGPVLGGAVLFGLCLYYGNPRISYTMAGLYVFLLIVTLGMIKLQHYLAT